MNSYEMLFRVAERFGLPVVLLLLVMWWVRQDVVQPLLAAHFGFINEVVAGQKAHTESVREVGRKLDALIEITQQSK